MISSRIMNNSCDLYRASYTTGDYGNVAETLTLVQSGIRCYVTALGGSKPVYAGKLQVVATHRLFVDVLNSMKSNDKIYVPSYLMWFNVLFIDRCSNFNHHWEILLEEIDWQDVQEEMDSSSSSSSEEYSSSSTSSESVGNTSSSSSSSEEYSTSSSSSSSVV